MNRLRASPEAVDHYLSRPDAGVVAAVARFAGPVLVLGAGGKMGLHLCLMLRAAAQAGGGNLRVIAVSRFRTLRDRETFSAAGIETIAADLSSAEELAALPDAPTVFFLAGVKFGTSASPELLEEMNVKMPRLVAARFAGARIVAFSTGCVYPFVPVNSAGATESTPVAPVGAYAESCLRREQAFAEGSVRHGTPTVLLRLNYSVEFRYGVLVDIAGKVWRDEPVDVTMGHVNVIWQPDAVSHIIQSMALAAAPAVAVNVTGPQVYRVRELAAKFGAIFGRTPRIVGTEADTAWLNDASYSHRLFGRPAHGLDEMVALVAGWLSAGGATWGKPTGFEKRDGEF